jgi:hypothetical protein
MVQMHVPSNNLKACPASPYDAGDMTSDMTSWYYRRRHGSTAAVTVSPPPSYGIPAAAVQYDDGGGTIFDA